MVPLIRRLALLLALEGVLLAGLGLVYGVAGWSDDGDRAPALVAGGFAVVAGAVLVLVARGVDGGRRWSRGPAVAMNLFPVGVGLSLLGAGVWWVGLPLLVVGGAVLSLFATPELREGFREGS